jgi:hypothetical protein
MLTYVVRAKDVAQCICFVRYYTPSIDQAHALGDWPRWDCIVNATAQLFDGGGGGQVCEVDAALHLGRRREDLQINRGVVFGHGGGGMGDCEVSWSEVCGLVVCLDTLPLWLRSATQRRGLIHSAGSSELQVRDKATISPSHGKLPLQIVKAKGHVTNARSRWPKAQGRAAAPPNERRTAR